MSAQAESTALEYERIGQAYGVPMFSLVFATRAAVVKEKPDLCAKFMQGAMEGLKYAYLHPEEAIEIHLDMVKEFKGDNSDQDYSTFLPYVPLNGSPEANKTGRTYLTGRTSRIGFEAATPSSYGPIGVKLEGDFNNDPRTGNAAVSGSIGNIFTQQSTNSYNFSPCGT